MSRRTGFAVGFLIPLVFYALWAFASSSGNNPSNNIGKTNKSGGAGCGPSGCHGSASALITSTISGPKTLNPGQTALYTMTVAYSGSSPDGRNVGVDIAAGDANSLSVADATYTQIPGNNEVTHKSPTKVTSGGSAAYTFNFTMPAAATAGSTHKLYGVGVVSWNNGYDHATDYNVFVLPNAPSAVSNGNIDGSTVTLNITGGGPRYRVVYAQGATPPPTPASGSLGYQGSSTNPTIAGLSANTQYAFAVYSKVVEEAVYSTTSATTTATTTQAYDPNPIVDVVNGSDGNVGTVDAPLKTITKALTTVGTNGTVTVKPGTYNVANGETFPLNMVGGVKLISTGGAAATIIDATGANQRVIDCFALPNTTKIEGFTITGGFYEETTAGQPATGGGVRSYIGDYTTITRCIITGNEVRGYTGQSMNTTGGAAYGGGIGVFNSNPTITNCVIRNNIARGGAGYDENAAATNGGTGGIAQGGGAAGINSSFATFINNTFYGNQAIAGPGGNAESGIGGMGGTATYGALAAANSTATNNIFASNVVTAGPGGTGSGGNGNPGGAVTGGITAAAASYNLFHNNTAGDGFTGTNEMIGQDPLFVSGSDLHLRSASPAKRAGTASGAPSVDLENVTRTSPPTIGAYEVGLYLTATAGIGRITVSWPGVSGATSHNLYMARVAGVTKDNYASLTGGAKITAATSPYVLWPLANGTTYYFVLTAVEQGIEGPISPEVSATSSAGNWAKAVLSGTNFTNITRDLANGNTLYASANDSAGVYKSTDGGDTWTAISNAVVNGRDVRAVAANGSTVFATAQDGDDVLRSTDGGVTWSIVMNGTDDSGETTQSLAIDPLNTNTVYAGSLYSINNTGDRPIKSIDNGDNWTRLPTNQLRAHVFQIDPITAGTVWAAGTGTPAVSKDTNGFAAQTDVSPSNGGAHALALAPSSPTTVYCGLDDLTLGKWAIHKTTNGGTNWTVKNNGFGTTPPAMHTLLVDPSNSNRVHAGTAGGYYTTTDGGDNWALGPASGAYPSSTLVFNAFVQTSSGRLVGTTSNGIYMLPLVGGPTINAVGTPNAGSTAGGDSRTISGTGFVASTGLRVLFGGVDAVVNLGASNASSITLTTPAHAAGTVDVAVINPDGQAAISPSAFTFNSCASYLVSPANANYSSTAASGSVTVTTNAGCSWSTSVPGGSFVSITGGANGIGSGTVNYDVAQNATAEARTTTLTIAGLSFVVTQSASGVATFALNATASATQVATSWGSLPGAVSYDVYRSSGGAFGFVATTSALSYDDASVSPGTGYLYRIHAKNGVGTVTAYSNVDLAVPFAYTDPVTLTIIKAAHFSELRSAANAARASVGLAPMTYTGSIVSGIIVQRIHLVEIRSAVDSARAAAGLPPLTYVDSTITSGATAIKGAHIHDLRNGLQ